MKSFTDSVRQAALFFLFVIGPAGINHEAAVNLFQNQNPCHQVRKCQIRELPAGVGSCKKRFSGTKGACNDKNQVGGPALPGGKLRCKLFGAPFLSMKIKENAEIGGTDLLQCPCSLPVLNQLRLCGPVCMGICLILYFHNLSLAEGGESFQIFLLKRVQRFVFHVTDAENGYIHVVKFLCNCIWQF